MITVYTSAPVIPYLFPWILGHIAFSHFLRFPFFVDLSRPELVLNHTCNFYLNTDEGVSVGVWHTLPASQWEEAAGKGPEWYRETLEDGNPVIIYLHGNLGTRAIHHHVELVKILSAVGYHILSLDYRGSITDAIILEAPFTRVRDVVESHVITKMYLFLPGFQNLLWDILEKNNIDFANEENLKVVTSPLLILHTEDIVPYHMGLKLYQISLQARKITKTDVQVEMISDSEVVDSPTMTSTWIPICQTQSGISYKT